MTAALRVTKRKDGVAVISFDAPGSPVNILSKEFFGEFEAALELVESSPDVKACVLASAKPDSFIAGANLKQILVMKDAAEGEAFSRGGHLLLNRMDSCKKPFVAAIHGAALGGGLEVALACHYRLATDHPKTQLGQPEVMLGLLPGGGGCQRLPRLIGLRQALPMMLTGKRLRARQAKRLGLVDALTSPGGLVDTAARAALQLADGKLVPIRRLQLLDRLLMLPPFRGFVFKTARKEAGRKTRGLYPAPPAILDVVETGLREGALGGEEKEAVEFGKLVASQEAKNLIRLFDAMTEMKKGEEEGKRPRVRRLAVLGAGLMGEGIASVSLSLSAVVLKDVADGSLQKAAKSLHGSLERRLRSGSLTRVERDRQWSALSLTTRPEDVSGADLVIEAVFEDLLVKRKVLAETERVLRDDAVFASNTSALPIAEIAAEAKRPERVLGMHYFSPVPKMPLLEVVVAAKTAGWAVEVARSYGIAQGKTVIVVKDGPGFYTTRILAPYMNESIVLLDEGAEVRSLDAALKDFGFPVGPMTLLDEVGIDVGAHVSKDLGEAFARRGLSPSPSLQKMSQAGYAGRKNGRGFYRYGKGKGAGGRVVNDEIYSFFGGHDRKELPPREVAERLALLMVNEAVYCLQEDVIASPRDGDVGAILGLGFPPFRGGPFRHVDSLGAWAVVSRMKKLGETLGPRFHPAPLLVDHAKAEKRFYPEG